MKLKVFPTRGEFRDLCGRGNVVPVAIEALSDTATPIAALARAAATDGPVFLLESVEGGERWGRYSFLGGGVRETVRVFAEAVEVSGKNGATHIPHGGDPLAVLRRIAGAYRPAAPAGLPRFWGGLVGTVTYEAVSFFERIPNLLPPGALLAEFVVTDGLLVFDNLRHTVAAVSHAFLDDDPDPDRAYDAAIARAEAALESLAAPAHEPLPGPAPGRLAPTLASGEFERRVAHVKTHIERGDIIQAVIAQEFRADPGPDPVSLYRAQRYVNPSPYLFFLRLGGETLVGSSPETMVRLESGVATLRPIAGTRPRGGNEQEDRRFADELLRDPKERAEHLMLVDLGRNDLGRVAETGTVQVTDLMVVERYSHVMHLVSNITCDLRAGCDAWELLRATFPAGTLSGAPKVRAMEIIADVEAAPRGAYGGAVGYVSFSGAMDLAITIRTASLENGVMSVRAGAGIVADSDPVREREETENKARAMERALDLVRRA